MRRARKVPLEVIPDSRRDLPCERGRVSAVARQPDRIQPSGQEEGRREDPRDEVRCGPAQVPRVLPQILLHPRLQREDGQAVQHWDHHRDYVRRSGGQEEAEDQGAEDVPCLLYTSDAADE